MFHKTLIIVFLISSQIFQRIDCKTSRLVSMRFCDFVDPSLIVMESSMDFTEKLMNLTVIVGRDVDDNKVEALVEYARIKESHSYIKLWGITTTLCKLLENETGDIWIDLSENYGNFSCPFNRGEYKIENFPNDFGDDKSLFVGFYKLTLLITYDVVENSVICLELIFEVLD